jgi:hypothetical protein
MKLKLQAGSIYKSRNQITGVALNDVPDPFSFGQAFRPRFRAAHRKGSRSIA